MQHSLWRFDDDDIWLHVHVQRESCPSQVRKWVSGITFFKAIFKFQKCDLEKKNRKAAIKPSLTW